MSPKIFLTLCILACIWAAPHLQAETTAESAEATAPAAAQQTAVEEPACLPPLDGLLGDGLKVETAGCTASYNCVHGGTVQCSAPFGTCTSIGQRCGGVTCDGVTTWCPGACMHAFNCATFCHQTYGSTDGDCDEFGCCVCF